MNFSKNIKILLGRNNIKSKKLAAIFKLTDSSVSSWMNKDVIPRADLLIDLSLYFNITLEELLLTDLENYPTKGLLGENNNLEPYQLIEENILNEDTLDYTNVSPDFKNKVLALLLKDKDIANAICQIVSERLKVK